MAQSPGEYLAGGNFVDNTSRVAQKMHFAMLTKDKPPSNNLKAVKVREGLAIQMAFGRLRPCPNLARHDGSRDRSRNHIIEIRRRGIRAHRRARRFVDLADRVFVAFLRPRVFFVLSRARLRDFFTASIPITVTAMSPTELLL